MAKHDQLTPLGEIDVQRLRECWKAAFEGIARANEPDLRTFEGDYPTGPTEMDEFPRICALGHPDCDTPNECDIRAVFMCVTATEITDDTVDRCVDVLTVEPFSMREDRAVEVARAVLKAALDR